MALDLNKPRRPRAVLGRGPLPAEVTKPDVDDKPPMDYGFERSRRALSHEIGPDEVRTRLRSMGGPWSDPRSWKPQQQTRQTRPSKSPPGKGKKNQP